MEGLIFVFYGTISVLIRMHVFIYSMVQGAHNGAKTSFFSGVYLLSSECFSVLNRIILRHILSLQYSSFSLYIFPQWSIDSSLFYCIYCPSTSIYTDDLLNLI